MNAKDDLIADKGSIINEMFLHTADENYIVARWCHENGFYTDFSWNSVHSLEKYLKAVLLFNGIPVGKFGHNLTDLYAEVETFASDLLPSLLTKPVDLQTPIWHDEKPGDFLRILEGNGNADNRYLTYGYAHRSEFLHMVDSVVWAVRRLAVPLDTFIFNQNDVPNPPTYRSVLLKQPDYSFGLSLPLDQLVRAPDSDAKRAFLNNNCAFAPDDFQHEPVRSGFSARNPVIYRRIIEPLRSSDRSYARQGYRTAEWLLSDTKQPGVVKTEVKAEMANARIAHPGIENDVP